MEMTPVLLFAAADGKLLGVHIIGQEACELIGIGLTALVAGMNAYHLVNLCFNYPSLSDLYKYAAYDALDKLERQFLTENTFAQKARHNRSAV